MQTSSPCYHQDLGNEMSFLYLVVVLLCSLGSDAARILGIFPTPSWSHQLPVQIIMKALATRGHQITVITPNPLKVPLDNYTVIDVSFSYEFLHKNFDFAKSTDLFGSKFIEVISSHSADLAEAQLSSKPVQDFIRTNKEKFDIVLYEPVAFQCYFGLVHQVGSPPLVGILSLGPLNPVLTAMGNPDHPAYSPDWANPLTDHMTFLERVYSTMFKPWSWYHWYWIVMPKQEAIMRKFFGAAPPPVVETERNRSLLMSYNHWAVDYPRPLLPNVVPLTGLHLKLKQDPLPQNVQQFLDEANEGAIYFSLGSNVRSDRLPKEKIAVILEAFSEIPQRVIWKWESDTLPGQPSNVMLGKWLPQEDILAHPNIRAFIFQGGLQSFQEATYSAVPLIAIPFFSDQPYNARKLEHFGIGVKIELEDLTKKTFLEAINKVLQDPRYRNNMQQVSAVFREEAAVSLDRAVWWIEYILRHKGAPHLRSAALDLSWYQYLLLDVVSAVIIALMAVIAIVYTVLKTLFSLISRNRQTFSDRKKKL